MDTTANNDAVPATKEQEEQPTTTTTTTSHGDDALVSTLNELIARILSTSPLYAHLFGAPACPGPSSPSSPAPTPAPLLRLTSATPGHLTFSLPLRPHHLNSRGTLHGSTSCTLLDFVAGPAIASMAAAAARAGTAQDVLSAKRGVSTDMSVQFMNAPTITQGEEREQELVVEARVKKAGRSLAWVGMQVFFGGKLCVEGSHTKYLA